MNSYGETLFSTWSLNQSDKLSFSSFLTDPFAKSAAFQHICSSIEMRHGSSSTDCPAPLSSPDSRFFKASEWLLNNPNFGTTCPSVFHLPFLFQGP